MNWPVCEKLVLSPFREIVRRSMRDPDYPYIDTKVDIVTGADFSDPLRGRDAIYGWIQGRGMEALAGHIRAFAATEPALCAEAARLLRRVTEHMESCRQRNGGRVFFLMNRAGERLAVRNYREAVPHPELPQGSNYTDIFYFKGLFHAGVLLEEPSWRAAGEAGCRRVLADLEQGNFQSDQEFFDPKNPARLQPGKQSQGPWMLMLGALAGTGWDDDIAACFRHIVTTHVRRDGGDGFAAWDFIESVDDTGHPWRESSGAILCDPGHALEFVGLSAKCLLQLRRHGRRQPTLEAAAREILAPLAVHVFHLGFQPRWGGIVKSYDLAARRVANHDMPWWSLPETVRAAELLVQLFPDLPEAPELRRIAACALAAFERHYVNWGCAGMAYQTRGADGRVAPVIPATPDADPGYHTGLSLLDAGYGSV